MSLGILCWLVYLTLFARLCFPTTKGLQSQYEIIDVEKVRLSWYLTVVLKAVSKV